MTSGSEFSSQKWEGPAIALTKIETVKIGMTYKEVAGIMGDTVSIGYKESSSLEGAYEEIFVPNPYYDEVFQGSKTWYRVVYYFTHIRKADGIVTDDELTPLVFEENRLIGKGRSFLLNLKAD